VRCPTPVGGLGFASKRAPGIGLGSVRSRAEEASRRQDGELIRSCVVYLDRAELGLDLGASDGGAGPDGTEISERHGRDRVGIQVGGENRDGSSRLLSALRVVVIRCAL